MYLNYLKFKTKDKLDTFYFRNIITEVFQADIKKRSNSITINLNNVIRTFFL